MAGRELSANWFQIGYNVNVKVIEWTNLLILLLISN